MSQRFGYLFGRLLSMMHSNGGDKRKRGRDRNKCGKLGFNYEIDTYRNISFHERPSSGRPGSPHRYFDASYDVVFNDRCDDDDVKESVQTIAERPSSPKSPPQTTECLHHTNMNTAQTCGHQVVHRHLSGLCIVTAGNMVETMMKQSGDDLCVTSIQFLVNVGKDSQSARGKLRTKNKKQQKHVHVGNNDGSSKERMSMEFHDGNVSPRDPLCQITLSNGIKFQLHCCVLGTIIELNSRLLDSDSIGLGSIGKTNGLDNRDPSLILRDPLLDGYLAVIIPRGSFPPKTRNH